MAKVFDRDNLQHGRFKPVLYWITKGQGSVIYGGSKYKSELKRASRYIPILAELNKQGRVIELPDQKVDVVAKEVSDFVGHKNFDDEHLVAIVRVACCHIICTDDKMAEPFLKRRDLYPKGLKKPRIYKNAQHETLCCRNNVVGKCRERLDQRG